MLESYRLLRECLWLTEALEDPEYPPHLIDRQIEILRPQLVTQLEAMEADAKWSSQHDDASIFLIQRLPEDWDPKIFEPSSALRYTAKSRELEDHRVLVLARDPTSLTRWTTFYHRAQNLARRHLVRLKAV